MDVEDINTCYPGKIISFDGETQTCTCQIQVEDYYSGIEYSYLKQEAPVLVDVPVYVPQAGGWMLTFPVKEGDDCLVLYAQKGYDHWSSFSGNVTVGGNLTVAGGISMGGARKGSTCTLNGSLVMNGDSTFNGGATFSKDVTAEGKSVSKHTHIDAEGRPTQPPS